MTPVPNKRKTVSMSLPNNLIRQLDEVTYKLQWVHDVKLSRSELVRRLIDNEISDKDTDEIIDHVMTKEAEEEEQAAAMTAS